MSSNYQIDLKKSRPIKAIVQIGIGKLITANPDQQNKIIEDANFILTIITGQKPKIVVAKKSIAGFKLRKGMPVALLVTLRKKNLYYFIQRLITYALPRSKDFYGLKKNNFDRYGNINLGFKEATIFPEVISDKIKYNLGFQVSIVASSKSKEENFKLWQSLGFPLKI